MPTAMLLRHRLVILRLQLLWVGVQVVPCISPTSERKTVTLNLEFG